jgi:hypothetical protein
MSVKTLNIFLHVMAIIMNGTKYCPTEIFHVQVLNLSYHGLRIMLNQHFIPYVVCR